MKLPYENKLRAGDECWDIRYGKIRKTREYSLTDYPIRIVETMESVTTRGFINVDHKFPMFLTIENARALGFMPKEPLKIEFDGRVTVSGHDACIFKEELNEHIGKPCHVVVTINE